MKHVVLFALIQENVFENIQGLLLFSFLIISFFSTTKNEISRAPRMYNMFKIEDLRSPESPLQNGV